MDYIAILGSVFIIGLLFGSYIEGISYLIDSTTPSTKKTNLNKKRKHK